MNLVEITIKAEAGDVLAKIEAIKASIDSLGNKTVEINANVDRNNNGISGWLTKIANLLPGVTTNSGLAAAGFVSLGTVAVAAVAAIGLALMPLIISMGLVTAGIAGFAAFAVPEFSKVWAAVGQGKKAIDALPPAEREVAETLSKLKDQFGQIAKAIQPQILKAFAEGLKIVKDLLPALEPLLKAAGKAVDGLLKSIDGWLKSPAGQKFIHWLEVEAPVALHNFQTVAWNAIKIVGSVLKWLWDTGENVDHAFKTIWHDMAVGIDTVKKDYQTGSREISMAIDAIRKAWVTVGHDIEAIWNNLKAAFKSFWANVTQQTDASIAQIVTAWNHLRNAVVAIWNAIVGSVRAAVSAIASAWSAVTNALVAPVRAAAGIIMGIIGGIVSAVNSIAGAISSAVGAARSAGSAIGGFLGHLGLEHGGIIGAAGGGPRGGWTMVGEHGAELVKLPLGSTVYSNDQSKNMVGQGSGTQTINLVIDSSGSQVDNFIAQILRRYVRVHAGGNVQTAFGSV